MEDYEEMVWLDSDEPGMHHNFQDPIFNKVINDHIIDFLNASGEDQ